MEKIKINEIEVKATGLVIVKYNDGKEATMNTKWQAQEVDYLHNDVGIGGTVSVLIAQKGDYTNITKVDFSSAVKGNLPVMPDPNSRADINLPVGIAQDGKIVFKEKPQYRTPEEMVAAEILKGAVELTKEEMTEPNWNQEAVGVSLTNHVNELTGAYALALSNVKAL